MRVEKQDNRLKMHDILHLTLYILLKNIYVDIVMYN